MVKKIKFKFDRCSNHFYCGCNNKPEIKHKQKEMCMKCFAQAIYDDLEFGIKYGKDKGLYQIRPEKLKAFD